MNTGQMLLISSLVIACQTYACDVSQKNPYEDWKKIVELSTKDQVLIDKAVVNMQRLQTVALKLEQERSVYDVLKSSSASDQVFRLLLSEFATINVDMRKCEEEMLNSPVRLEMATILSKYAK